MRRVDRQLSEEQSRAILSTCNYGVLGTIGENGYPYAVPLSYVFVNDKIYFHCAKNAGHKLANIGFCPNVCFTVVGDTNVLPDKFSTAYESVIVFGKAQEMTEGVEEIALRIIEKFSPGFIEEGKQYIEKMIAKTAFFEITIEQMTGKSRPNH